MLLRTGLFLLVAMAAAGPAWGTLIRVPEDFTDLERAVGAAAPGDTVLISPTGGKNGVTVRKDILLLAQAGAGDVHLTGLDLGPGRAEGFFLHDARAADNAVFTECIFNPAPTGGTTPKGLTVEGANVVVVDCLFSNLITGIEGNVARVENSTLTECLLGIALSGTEPCAGERQPADVCVSGCPETEIVGCRFDAGETLIRAQGMVLLRVTDSFLEHATTGILMSGGRLVLETTDLGGNARTGIGVHLQGASGVIRNNLIEDFETGILIDALCGAYTDVQVGGNLNQGNRILDNEVNLRLAQPEWVGAADNHWGSVDCEFVQGRMTGQSVDRIADTNFTTSFPCIVPVEPVTWGRIKSLWSTQEP